jgi:hypothetical protein
MKMSNKGKVNKKIYKKTTNDPAGWWYYFETVNNGETNKCKKCGWEQLRNKSCSTYGLKYHLETIHPELNSKRLEEIRIKERKKKPNNNNMDAENLNPFINNWPFLWPLVRKYLSAPCGSVESEILFSQAKYITTDLRKRLSTENLKKILFVHENLPLIDYNY